ncbi:MAG: hypothetical protein R6U61_00880 [Thermoplasmata archaeon]
MKIRKKTLGSILIITMLLIINIFSIPVQSRRTTPAEKMDPPKYYSHEMHLEYFEHTFFPHHYRNGESYNFTVPHYWNNVSISHDFLWDEEFQGYQQPPEEAEEWSEEYQPPPLDKRANISIVNEEGKYIFTRDNLRTNVGGGGPDTHNYGDSKYVKINSRGGCEIIFCICKEWDDLINKPQDVSFEGRAITYNLYGVSWSWIKGFKGEYEYLELTLKTDIPVKAYAFGDSDGSLLSDYDESKDLKKKLDYMSMKVTGQPYLTMTTFDNYTGSVNASFTLEIKEYSTYNFWVLLGLAVTFIMGFTIYAVWVNKRG